MLHKSFKSTKCETALKLASARIKVLKTKREAQAKQLKKELAQLLEAGHSQTARIRVEHVIKEEKTMAAYDLIEIYCELLVASLPIIESQKACPIDLKEAISSIIFASPRCSDVPELIDIRKLFTAKYGKEFVSAAVELRPDCGVSRLLVEKLSAKAPDGPTKIQILSAIAEEHNVKWDPKSFEEKVTKPPEDLLDGPNTFEKASNILAELPNIQEAPNSINRGPPGFHVPSKDYEKHGGRRHAEEVAQSEIDQSRCKTTLLETESEIANIQEVPVQSGTLYSLKQSDGLSEMSLEAIAQNHRILMRSGMALTKPPECQEWERFTEIYLIENEFSELPENLRCFVLQALFLNRNSKLRMIPHSFFNNMPALQILNISRTRIKFLPKSLFELINLKRLFLNHCELLMRLPPEIGQLQNLEILDLEGTRITNLPREVQQLTNLTCLEVSFNEPVNHRKMEQLYEVIPVGVLTALRQLEEVNIDVSPVDKRWNACVVAVVYEVCGLTALNTLKIYLPQVELLSRFNWYSAQMGSSSLSHFRLTVGHHIKRVLSRIPDDIEMGMDQYDRCLKYVNGVGIPEEIKVVLGQTNAFFLDRHTDIKTFSELGCENLMQLKWCVVGECNELKAIIHGDQMSTGSSNDKNIGLTALEYLHIYYMKNLRSIWEGPICNNGFISLKKLTFRTCPQLTTIFTSELLASFSNLKEVVVNDCHVITCLVSCYNSGYESTSFLPKLKKISLHYLPKLVIISSFSGVSLSPTLESLEWMSIYNCPNLL